MIHLPTDSQFINSIYCPKIDKRVMNKCETKFNRTYRGRMDRIQKGLAYHFLPVEIETIDWWFRRRHKISSEWFLDSVEREMEGLGVQVKYKIITP